MISRTQALRAAAISWGLALLVAACVAGCAAPVKAGPWTTRPDLQSQADCIVAAVHSASVDLSGLLDRGGMLVPVEWGSIDGMCGTPGDRITGCCLDQWIFFVLDTTHGLGPLLTSTALSHELCHLAYNASDPDPRIDACALIANQRCLP